MSGNEIEVVVDAQQCQIVPDAELGEQGVDRADLNSGSAASISEFGRRNVILTVGLEQRKRCEALDYLCARLRAGEALKQFLKDEACCHDDVGTQESIL